MLTEVESKQGSKPKIYEDYRELCTDKDIDAVMIATLIIFALISILAAQNGKHVCRKTSFTQYLGRTETS